MAKKRKGAKKVSASRSKPKGQKTKKPSRPVSPVPKKRAPVKRGGSAAKKRSSAARKGWETRRRNNPLRWGREALAKREKNSKVVDSSAKAIEREWREIERKALKQAEEAAAFGGVHPSIAGKLAVFERIEAQLAEMKTNIRRFNSPSPDKWELQAYTLLEKFITLKDFGASSDDLKHAHQEWYTAKMAARTNSKDWPAWMAMIGSVLGLPMHGDFSVDSFVTS